MYISSSRSPWHKDSLHLTILPGLEVALLRGDVLHKLASLVAANLDRCVIFTCNCSKLCSCVEIVTFSVFLKTQLDGAQMSLGTLDTIVVKHNLKCVPLQGFEKNDPGAHSISFVIRTVITHLPAGSFRIHLLHSFFLEGALKM